MTDLASPTTTGRGTEDTSPGQALSGHNRISTQALTSVAQAVAADVLGVSAHRIRASWRDDEGLLALALVLPVEIPSLNRIVREPTLLNNLGGSIWDRALAARGAILEEVTRLTGSQLSRVDIRITGIRVKDGGRVQ